MIFNGLNDEVQEVMRKCIARFYLNLLCIILVILAYMKQECQNNESNKTRSQDFTGFHKRLN